MKRYIALLLVIACFHTIDAQIKWNRQSQSYVNQYKDLAIGEMVKYHIPASITLAQGILESRAGLSVLVTQGNNHFGIKCHGWAGASVTQDDDEEDECFRAYKNAYESYEDHSKFLAKGKRYRPLFQLDTKDYTGWANGLKDCGYATNPQYAQRLIQIIETYKLYLYDDARTYNKFMAERAGTDHPIIAGQPLHPIYMYNDNYYLLARDGDTFRAIGEEVDISYRSLAKYNERDKGENLRKGDIVYLRKKRKKAIKEFMNKPYVVKAGDSMYSIAQRFAIRLTSLYKMNELSPDYDIKVGDSLKVY